MKVLKTHKICTSCKVVFPVCNFARAAYAGWEKKSDGFVSKCFPCRRKYHREYKRKDPEKYKAYQREWYRRNPGAIYASSDGPFNQTYEVLDV